VKHTSVLRVFNFLWAWIQQTT